MSRRDAPSELIELIPVDADLFDANATPSSPLSALPPMPRNTVAEVTMALLTLLAVAAVVGVALVPGERAARTLTFPPLRRQLPTLDGHVVFDDPPGELIAAADGTIDGGQTNSSPLRLANGYLFAEDGAHFTLSGEGDGRWAQFWTEPGIEIAPALTNGMVQGAPATIDDRGVDITIAFGPVDGRGYQVRTHGLDLDASRRVAGAIGVRSDGSPVLRDDRVLAGMHPVGSIAEYGAVLDVLLVPGDSSVPSTNLVFARYADADNRLTIASVPAPADDMFGMFGYFFPQGHRHELRGTNAWVLGDGVNPDLLASGTGTLVAWVEGGRLLMVVSPYDEQTTVALADGVRATTAEEWAAIEKVAALTPNPLSSSITRPGDEVQLLVGLDPATGEATSVTEQWDGDQLLVMCATLKTQTSCSSGAVKAPYVATLQVGGSRYLVVVVPRDAADHPEVHLTFEGGTRDDVYRLSEWGRALPGPALGLLLPNGVDGVEVWNGGALWAAQVFVNPAG